MLYCTYFKKKSLGNTQKYIQKIHGGNVKVEIEQLNGLTLVGKSETKHMVIMDANEQLGGSDAAMRPMEMMLVSLGGCTGMDVISILQKKRTPFSKVNIEIEAERAESHPKVFTKINILFIVSGDKEKIKPKDIERAIELTNTTYCSASAMLRKTAELNYDFKIIDDKEG